MIYWKVHSPLYGDQYNDCRASQKPRSQAFYPAFKASTQTRLQSLVDCWNYMYNTLSPSLAVQATMVCWSYCTMSSLQLAILATMAFRTYGTCQNYMWPSSRRPKLPLKQDSNPRRLLKSYIFQITVGQVPGDTGFNTHHHPLWFARFSRSLIKAIIKLIWSDLTFVHIMIFIVCLNTKCGTVFQ